MSVVVCAHNEERYLGQQLAALLAQETKLCWELVVVDNRSTDRTAALVEQFAASDKRVTLVRADARASKAYAMDIGVAVARADHLLFCDADDMVAPGWLDALASALDQHEVVTGPHNLDHLNPKWLADSRGRSIEREAAGTFLGLFPTIRGAGWGLRRDVWDSLGGMRSDLHAAEDLEFSFRCWMNGVDIVGVMNAVVYYRYRSSLGALWRQGFAYGLHRPVIARLVNESGRARAPKFAGRRSWLMLAVKLPSIYKREGRATWVWIAANRLGQIAGSVRERTVML